MHSEHVQIVIVADKKWPVSPFLTISVTCTLSSICIFNKITYDFNLYF